MKKSTLPSSVVSVEWLNRHLTSPDLVILNATAKSSHIIQIPGAIVFDYDKVFCDKNSSLPHMMPSAEEFQKNARAIGINNDSNIVVYDEIGIFSSPRVYWMFKSMGFNNIAVLNGGLPLWVTYQYPIEHKREYKFQQGNFIANPQSQYFISKSEVENAITKKIKIVDARSHSRFIGIEDEPRPGLKRGHIPSSQNLPYSELLNEFTFKTTDEIKQKFETLNLVQNGPTIFSCGSGVTACILAIAAELCGFKDLQVYDGSWTEWGQSNESQH